METSRLKAIRAIKSNMPVADKATAQQMKAGNDFLLQRAVGQMPLPGTQQASVAAPAAASQIGTTLAGQMGQQQVAEVNKQRTTTQQLGNLAMGAQQLQFQGTMGADVRQVQSKLFDAQQKLGRLDEAAKADIFGQRLQLANEDMTNKFLNERNLWDYQVMQGKSEEQMRDYAQTATQAYQKKQRLMEAAYNKLLQGLEQEYQQGNLKLDQAQKERLTRFKVEVEKQMRKDKAKASGISSIFGAAGTILGAAGGFIITGGNPAGAMAGASVGQGLGTMAASGYNS